MVEILEAQVICRRIMAVRHIVELIKWLTEKTRRNSMTEKEEMIMRLLNDVVCEAEKAHRFRPDPSRVCDGLKYLRDEIKNIIQMPDYCFTKGTSAQNDAK
jgi:hypothetical protein